jgi:hypothetical protein
MNAVRVETTVEVDGELQRTDLPCRRGDKAEAIARLVYEPHALTAAGVRMVEGETSG